MARACKELDRTFYDSRRIRVINLEDYHTQLTRKIGSKSRSSFNERPSKRRKQNRPDLTNVYVCPVPEGVKEEQLRGIFSRFGAVQKVTILHHHRGGKDAAGKPGFVDFFTNEDAQRCIDTMHGRELTTYFPDGPKDRKLIVRFSDSHNRDKPSTCISAGVDIFTTSAP
eukprot:UN24347